MSKGEANIWGESLQFIYSINLLVQSQCEEAEEGLSCEYDYVPCCGEGLRQPTWTTNCGNKDGRLLWTGSATPRRCKCVIPPTPPTSPPPPPSVTGVNPVIPPNHPKCPSNEPKYWVMKMSNTISTSYCQGSM